MSLSPTYPDIIFSCLSVRINTERQNMSNMTRMRQIIVTTMLFDVYYLNWLDNIYKNNDGDDGGCFFPCHCECLLMVGIVISTEGNFCFDLALSK